MLESRKLTEEEFSSLYKKDMTRDFPPDELRPYPAITVLIEEGKYLPLGFFEEGALTAYACIAMDRGLALLDYYAVMPQLRGTGVGSRCLQALHAMKEELHADAILLEVERVETTEIPAEKELRRRRICFYQRAGCKMTRVCSKLFGVDYNVMVLPLSPAVPETAQVRESLGKLYEVLVNPLIKTPADYARVCRVWTE